MFTAIMSAPDDGEQDDRPDPDPELLALLDRKTWTEDRRLMAQLINSINILVRYLPTWQEGKEPDFPLVGPAQWREKRDETKDAPKATSVMDVLRLFTS